MDSLLVVLIVLSALILVVSLICLIRLFSLKPQDHRELKEWISDELRDESDLLREGLGGEIRSLKENTSGEIRSLKENSSLHVENMDRSLHSLQENVSYQIQQMRLNVREASELNERQYSLMNQAVSTGLKELRDSNEKQLQEIKGVVNEQLQETLDRKLKQSFDSVVDQLSKVEKGLGEMQVLATNVGDLKKTLSNVKTRGILGEMQLGAILEQILSPEQYATNVTTVKGSKDPVEFAIKLPGEGGDSVWLPIDSKFPGDTYEDLVDAYESGDPALIEEKWKMLEIRITQEAKDISTKYIHVPETTEFAIMFLPIEGLYAEVVRHGMVEKLQTKYKVNIAGPTTMAALLNSLQMGFRTLAIQKRSNEVWEILGNVKTEFAKYEDCLTKVQQRMNQTSEELEKLVGVRTRQINRHLSKVTSLETAVMQQLESEE